MWVWLDLISAVKYPRTLPTASRTSEGLAYLVGQASPFKWILTLELFFTWCLILCKSFYLPELLYLDTIFVESAPIIPFARVNRSGWPKYLQFIYKCSVPLVQLT